MWKFLQNAKRVITVAKKPGRDEFMQVAKVAGIGILLIGAVGFIIMFITYLIQGILPTT